MAEKMRDLIERVETDEGPDHALERDIGLSLGIWEWVSCGGTQMLKCGDDIFPDHPGAIYPSLLESLDTVVSLIEEKLPAWSWSLGELRGKPDRYRYRGFMSDHSAPDGIAIRHVEAESRTAARALLAAVLRALEQHHGQ